MGYHVRMCTVHFLLVPSLQWKQKKQDDILLDLTCIVLKSENMPRKRKSLSQGWGQQSNKTIRQNPQCRSSSDNSTRADIDIANSQTRTGRSLRRGTRSTFHSVGNRPSDHIATIHAKMVEVNITVGFSYGGTWRLHEGIYLTHWAPV